MSSGNTPKKTDSQKRLSPFDFINSISDPAKPDIMKDNPEAKKAYAPYIINRQFSYFQDTVLFANEMNVANKLDSQMQYDFYRLALRPRKRFSKWIKPQEIENIDIISRYYQIDKEKAKAALDILKPKAIEFMRKHLSRGGMSKDK